MHHNRYLPFFTMTDNKRVAIVIVNWNGKENTLLCLSSLVKLKKSGVTPFPVVVDNNSQDGSVFAIRKQFPGILVVESSHNEGFVGGTNRGIREALGRKADFIWLLNNDTVVDPDALSLVNAFEDVQVGVVGSKIYFAKGFEYHKDRYGANVLGKVLWYAGGLIDWSNMYASHRGVDDVDTGQYDVGEETSFVTGCSMMIRKETLERIGLLDPAYYLYLEDLDFCLRARRAGFTLWYEPRSVVWHRNASSSGGPGNPLHEYYMTRNRFYLGMRYAPIRTKFALPREGVRFLVAGGLKRRATLDAISGRMGKQYEP